MVQESLLARLEAGAAALEGFMETRHNYIPAMGWEQVGAQPGKMRDPAWRY